MNGFLVIDKPAGWTSHDVVAKIRRLAGTKRVGHTGTLDPDATGVLLVCLGLATRLIEYTADHHKRYEAGLALGVTTDSQDASGEVTARRDASAVRESDLAAVLPAFTGEIEQVPPMVSAVHHNGERLYDIARRGETVERAPRPVTIYALEASGFVPGETAKARLSVECSAGTYIRTLCNDIGQALGVGGHMTDLRRTSVGPFSLADSVDLNTLMEEGHEGVVGRLHPSEELVPSAWPVVAGSDEEAARVVTGRTIAAASDGQDAAFFHNGRLLAVLRREGGEWRPAKVFPPA